MRRRNAPSNKRKTRKGRPRPVLSVRAGTTNTPPDNSGTVQIPRPMTQRAVIAKRTFKAEYTLTSLAGVPGVFFSTSLYTPFYAVTGAGSTYASSAPPSLVDMYAAYGLYKPKVIQLIFEPLLTSTTVPAPYTVAMTFDIATPLSSTVTNALILPYQNATKISPAYPTELRYKIPSVSAQAVNQIVLNGGWLDTADATMPQQYGFVVLTQSAGSSFSLIYSILTVVYDIWFKNPI